MSEDVTVARVIDAPPEAVFAAFTGQGDQEAFYSEPGWIVESECDLRKTLMTMIQRGRGQAQNATAEEQPGRLRPRGSEGARRSRGDGSSRRRGRSCA